VENTKCDVCHGTDETPAHVVFGCTAAREFWEAIQITTDPSWSVIKLQEITAPTTAQYSISKPLYCYAAGIFGRGEIILSSGMTDPRCKERRWHAGPKLNSGKLACRRTEK